MRSEARRDVDTSWMVFVLPVPALLVLVVILLAVFVKLLAASRLSPQWGVGGTPMAAIQ